MKTKRLHLILAASAILTPAVQAATLYWDGDANLTLGVSDNTSTTAMTWLAGGLWDNGTTSVAKTSWANWDSAIFGGTFAGTQTVTLSSGINLGNGSIIGGAGSSYKISLAGTTYNQLGELGGSGSITIHAGSTLSADAASNNAHNIGAITLNGGTLTSVNGPAGTANDGGFGNWVTHSVTVGGSSVSTISSSTLSISNGSFTVADAVAGAATDLFVSAKILSGALVKDGAGTMELSAANTLTSTSITNGVLLVSGANGALGTGTITVGANGTLEFASTTGAKTLTNNISGAGAILNNGSGANRYTFSGDNSGFTGIYTQTGAQTGFTAATAGSADANWVLNGTYFVSNIGTATLKLGTLSGSALHWNDSISGTSTLEVGGRGNDTTYSGNLGSGTSGAITALTKVGAGKLTLSAGNSYSGATAVNAGTLSLGTSGTIANSSVITVAAGATFDVSSLTSEFTLGGGKTLKGKGTISGNVAVSATGVGVITAGDGIDGTLTITGNLTITGSADVNVGTLANYTSTPALVVTGDITTVDLLINLPATTVGAGTYHLIGHSNTLADLNGIALGTQPILSARQVGNLVNNAGSLDYVVNGANPVWTGAVSSTWSTATLAAPKNWTLPGGGATDYIDGDVVLFNDDSTGSTVVDIEADVSPVVVEFANGLKNYTLQGSAGIAAGSLTKSGTGSLAINNANSYAGGTTLTGGTVTLGHNSAMGSGSVALNGGILNVNGTSPANAITLGGGTLAGNGTLGGLLSGAGLVYDSAGNTLALTAANTYSGNTAITAGTLELGGAGTLGGGTYGGTISNAGTLYVNTSAAQTLSGVISGGGALTKSGSGTLTLSGANSYTGTTTVNAGTLKISNSLASSSIQVASGATMERTVGGAFNSSLSGGGAIHQIAGTRLYLGGNNSSFAGTYTQSAGMLTEFDTNSSGSASASWVMNGAYLVFGGGAATTAVEFGALSGSASVWSDYTSTTMRVGALGTNTTFSGVIQNGYGTVALTKTGTGTLTLTGASSYTGATTVNAGTLELSNSLTSATTVKDTATLMGTGSVTAALTVETGGTVAPGTSIGTLTVGTTTINGTYACEVDATSSDLLAVSGNLTLSGATLTVAGLAGAGPHTIATYSGTLTGTFANVTAGYSVNYGSGSNSQITVTQSAGGFAGWATTNAPTGTANDDYDGDGVSNAVEYVLGGDKATNNLDRLPKTSTTEEGKMTFTFIRNQGSIATDTKVEIEVGTDLDVWDTYAVPDAAVANNPGVSVTDNHDGTDTVMLTVPMAPDKAKFARMKVTVTP